VERTARATVNPAADGGAGTDTRRPSFHAPGEAETIDHRSDAGATKPSTGMTLVGWLLLNG